MLASTSSTWDSIRHRTGPEDAQQRYHRGAEPSRVEILKQTSLIFEYGFMLFDPSSTFASVRANIRFLRTIVGDGCTPATFCKMLPMMAPPFKRIWRDSGRLRGDVSSPDYDFLDRRPERLL